MATAMLFIGRLMVLQDNESDFVFMFRTNCANYVLHIVWSIVSIGMLRH